MNQINAEAIFRNKAYSYRSRTIVYALLEKIKIVYRLLGLSKLLLNLTSSPTKNLLRVCPGRPMKYLRLLVLPRTATIITLATATATSVTIFSHNTLT